jgi:hypothetical protein
MVSIISAHGEVDVPELWQAHNWERPYAYLKEVASILHAHEDTEKNHGYLLDKIVSGFDLRKALERTSLVGSDFSSIPNQAFNGVLRSLYQALSEETCLFAGIISVGIEGWVDAAWSVEHSPRSLKPISAFSDSANLSEIIQGQLWAEGNGIFILLGIDWSFASIKQNNPEIAYAKALIATGRVGHAILLEGQHHGLSARMTPAIAETKAAEILDLDHDRDVLYFIKLAASG